MTNQPRRTGPVLVGELFTEFLRDNQPGYSREDGDRIAPSTFTLTADETADFHRENAERYHHANTPRMFADAAAGHPRIVDWVERYLNDRDDVPWLLIVGDVGTGKTHQAYGALRALAVSGRPTVRWRSTTAAALYARLRPGADTDFEPEFAGWADCPLLLLDDLGATRFTEFTEEVTYRLVDERYTANRLTIITSNLLPHQFAERFGKRTASRLRQACQLVDMGLTDRRRAPETDV